VIRRSTNGEGGHVSATVPQTNTASDPKVIELIALAAAVGSNCEACFRSHYETARAVGLSTQEILDALTVAEAVKATPAQRMRELAARKLDVPVDALGGRAPTPAAEDDAAGDCGCGPAAQAEPAPVVETECC
jgi:AhpD family alkylhydroperoxidase